MTQRQERTPPDGPVQLRTMGTIVEGTSVLASYPWSYYLIWNHSPEAMNSDIQ